MTTNPIFSDAFAFVAGTCRVGTVLASYEQLVAAFGPPHDQGADLDRITAEWRLRTRVGILTIYDRSAWAGGSEPPVGPIWWDLGGHPCHHADRALPSVVALVHELTGCPVRDARPWHSRPNGHLPKLD